MNFRRFGVVSLSVIRRASVLTRGTVGVVIC